jgi:hypothetical protein
LSERNGADSLQGTDRAAQVRGIEDQLYDAIVSTLNADDMQILVRIFRALTQDSPAGAALEKRLAAEQPPT